MKILLLMMSLLLTSTVVCVYHTDRDEEEHLSMPFTQAGIQVCVVDSQYAHILPNERNFRKELYWQDKYNPRYYLFERFPFAYYISILKDHIIVLEQKIVAKKSGWESSAIRFGILIGGMASFALYGVHRFYTKIQTALGNHHFSFDFNPQNETQNKLYQEGLSGAIFFSILSTVFTALAGNNFYKAYRYAERLLERLERDKRILATLEREKAVADDKQLALIDGAVDKLTARIMQSITSAKQTC